MAVLLLFFSDFFSIFGIEWDSRYYVNNYKYFDILKITSTLEKISISLKLDPAKLWSRELVQQANVRLLTYGRYLVSGSNM